MKNSTAIFIFDKMGNFLDAVTFGEHLNTHSILGDLPNRTLRLLREKRNGSSSGKTEESIFCFESQELGSTGHFEAIARELTTLGYSTYLFDKKQSEVASIILSAHLPGRNNLEFFDMLVATPQSKLATLKQGIEEDLASAKLD